MSKKHAYVKMVVLDAAAFLVLVSVPSLASGLPWYSQVAIYLVASVVTIGMAVDFVLEMRRPVGNRAAGDAGR